MAYARDVKHGSPGGEAAGAEGYAGVALDILECRHNGREKVRVLVLPDTGSLAGLSEGAAREVSCRIQGERFDPFLTKPIPEACRDLIRRVGLCERLVAESVLEGSEEKLRQALETNPLIGPEKADACMKAFAFARK